MDICCGGMDKEAIYGLIRSKGQRLTKQKMLLIDVFLENRDRMLSAAEICEYLEAKGDVDAATVYRNIQRFLDIGLFEVITDSGGFGRYMICPADHHHHHFICTKCGAVSNFPCIEPFWQEAAKAAGFREQQHFVEVHGICKNCSAGFEAVTAEENK